MSPKADDIVLPKGEGLDVKASVDPNEGWICVEYSIINFPNENGEEY